MILHHTGFPIRKSADLSDICSSPQLIAACHVLLRLLMPRHSPCALLRLNSFCISLDILLFSCLNCCNHFTVTVLAKLFPISRKDQFLVFLCFTFTCSCFFLYSVFNELSLCSTHTFVSCMSALTYFPGQSPAKYLRHCTA